LTEPEARLLQDYRTMNAAGPHLLRTLCARLATLIEMTGGSTGLDRLQVMTRRLRRLKRRLEQLPPAAVDAMNHAMSQRARDRHIDLDPS
jgi:Flp pilus assembly protein TadB